MSQFEEYNHRVITNLQSRIRTLEEELRICQLERNNWKGRHEALNILLSSEIKKLETNIKNKTR